MWCNWKSGEGVCIQFLCLVVWLLLGNFVVFCLVVFQLVVIFCFVYLFFLGIGNIMSDSFEFVLLYLLVGDQFDVIVKLISNFEVGIVKQILLGVIGLGKIYIIVNVIQNIQKLMLIMVLNKMLVVQLYGEFKVFFLYNVVEYFVSYYDYYQFEVYVLLLDIFIEKDSLINEYIEQMWLVVIKILLLCLDVIVVVMVLVIYGLGVLEDYLLLCLILFKGECIDQCDLINYLIQLQYMCNEYELQCGIFCVCGEVIDVFLVELDSEVLCFELFDGEVEKIILFDLLIGEMLCNMQCFMVYLKMYYVIMCEWVLVVIEMIKVELKEWLEQLYVQNKLVEVQCLVQCIQFDLEMMVEVGYCNGIENYFWYLIGKNVGELLLILFDYLLLDVLLVIDELYVIILQIGVMFKGDCLCKEILVEFGFCLLLVLDNCLLCFEEWEECCLCSIYVLVMFGFYELCEVGDEIIELVVCLIGLIDLVVEIWLVGIQVDDLMSEVNVCIKVGDCVLVIMLIKCMVENFIEYFIEYGICVCYLYLDVDMVECVEIICDLCLGKFDVLVGINLLCEGLDMFEVLLVVIFDVDKEGFLCFIGLLIQIIGCVVCNVCGKVILYVDKIICLMQVVIDEIDWCCVKQVEYNEEYGIVLCLVVCLIVDVFEGVCLDVVEKEVKKGKGKGWVGVVEEVVDYCLLFLVQLVICFKVLEQQMYQYVKDLEFEDVVWVCDQIWQLKEVSLG